MIAEIEYDLSENVMIINSLKYYYFGKTYSVMNSKKSLQRKKMLLNNIISEIENDEFLKAGSWKFVKQSITGIVFDQLKKIEYELDVKNLKKEYGLLKIFCR